MLFCETCLYYYHFTKMQHPLPKDALCYSCICDSGEEDEKFMTTTTCSNVTATVNGQLSIRTRNSAI